MSHLDPTRRRLLLAAAAAGLLAPVPWCRADAARLTPSQSRGPFYPVELPLDSDNDLVQVDGRPELAEGTASHLFGRITDEHGRPVSRAMLEIWQCDAHGRYRHPRDRGGRALDANFQGYGRFTTDADGRYRFRTIKPVPYPGRAPHIHVAIRGPGFEPLVTQMYVAGAPENQWDFLLNSIRDPKLRALLLVPFEPFAGPDATLAARFDIVLAADGRFAPAG
jgi:protocatechuate 3,4-dioxygenase beta subunit